MVGTVNLSSVFVSNASVGVGVFKLQDAVRRQNNKRKSSGRQYNSCYWVESRGRSENVAAVSLDHGGGPGTGVPIIKATPTSNVYLKLRATTGYIGLGLTYYRKQYFKSVTTDMSAVVVHRH